MGDRYCFSLFNGHVWQDMILRPRYFWRMWGVWRTLRYIVGDTINATKSGEVYERNFEIGPFFGGFQRYTYQFAIGISVSWLRCNGTRLLRLYFGPFKLWVNTREKHPTQEGTEKGGE